ncbi:protein of unknown function (plasmid) [Nitratireductor aquimarinus]
MPEWTIEHVIEIQAMTRSRSETPNSNTRDILGRPARPLTDLPARTAQRSCEGMCHHRDANTASLG